MSSRYATGWSPTVFITLAVKSLSASALAIAGTTMTLAAMAIKPKPPAIASVSFCADLPLPAR